MDRSRVPALLRATGERAKLGLGQALVDNRRRRCNDNRLKANPVMPSGQEDWVRF
jgi:hypothetical protein